MVKLYNVLIWIFFSLSVLIVPSKTYAVFNFTIPETSITKDTELNANVNLSLQGQGNKTYYLEGAFKNQTSSNYFGLTWNDSSWVNYTASNFTILKSITTDSTGNWSGAVKVKIDSGSSLFIGDGTYTLRLKRFTTGGSFSWADNTITLNVVSSSSTPTPSPTVLTPTSTSSPTSSPSTPSFAISNIPPQINSDQSFTVSVNLSLPNNPDTTYYLAGAFKIVGGTRYFGLTKTDSEWTEYSSSNFSSQYQITTNSSGVWTGNLEVKPDTTDSDYKGSGDYVFKLARYTQVGSQTWSNESNIKIISTEIEEQGATSTSDTPSSTTNPYSSPKSGQSAKSEIQSNKSKYYDRLEYHSGSIAGTVVTSTPSATPNAAVKGEKKINFLAIIGSILVIIGLIPISYAIYNKFRARDKEAG